MKTEAEVGYINEGEGWVAYSMPGEIDHTLIIGKISKEPIDEGSFILQGWDVRDLPRIYISPSQIITNGRCMAEVKELCPIQSTSRKTYDKILSRTIDRLRAGHLEKAVISKVKVVDRRDQNLFDFYQELKNKYVKAFTFIYHIPGQGTWCGATPEVLLHEESGCLITMALAGTLPYNGDLTNVPWTDKERHEQGVIETHVERVLQDLGIDYQKEGPSTVRAGQMVHLLSTYTTGQVTQPEVLQSMLHPGPAICGSPQEEAFRWINEEEEHKRDHYCGYLGPWGVLGQKAIFIHLRSMRIYQDKYALYLGGGITIDSDISSEWDETELKAQTMLAVINNLVYD